MKKFKLEDYRDNKEFIDQIALKAGFEETVPDIETFIDDPFYLGKFLGDGLYPIWRKAAIEQFPTPYITYKDEIILSGAIGQGKSTFALLVTLYDACRVLSLKNPHKWYNLIESTIISFALMNATKKLSNSVLYDQCIEWIEGSPYFKSKINPARRDKRRSLFIKNIDISTGSRGRDYLGQATIGAIFSEINDMTVVGGQAEDNLDTIDIRRASRFGEKGKPILGHLILDSSNKGTRSFIDNRLEEKRKHDDESFQIYAFTHWDAKWHLGTYSGKFFQVYAGDENIDPFIVNEENKYLLNNLKADRIVDVPQEHFTEFNNNIVKAIRDLAGISTFGSSSFISSNEIINSVMNRIDIVKKELIILDFFDKDQRLIDFLDIKVCTFLSKANRYIHIDLGISSDSTGISCTFMDGFKETTKFDPLTGRTLSSREPNYIVEWSMEIRAIPGQEVPIYKIKDFLIHARQMGLPIAKVSTDGYQSTNLRQDLKLKGINAELLSVDRTKDPYNYLRNCILEDRVSIPNKKKLRKEITELQENEDKFDHVDGSSKDILDSVCGSVYLCSQDLKNAGSNKAEVVKKQLALLEHSGMSRLEKMLTR